MKSTIMILAVAAALAGCDADDPCLAAHRRVIRSPSGSRRLDISAGPCPGSMPQILVMFDHGSGGGGVFAVDDSSLAARGRWIGEDTAEITYSASAHVSKRLTYTQYGPQHVTLLYVVRSDSGR